MAVSHTRQTYMSDVQECSVCTSCQRALNFSAASILGRAIFSTSPFLEAVCLFLHRPGEHDLY